MTLQSTAVYCCGHRPMYCIVYIPVQSSANLTLWFFDNISTGSNSYICCSQVLWNLLGTISHIERGCGYSAG